PSAAFPPRSPTVFAAVFDVAHVQLYEFRLSQRRHVRGQRRYYASKREIRALDHNRTALAHAVHQWTKVPQFPPFRPEPRLEGPAWQPLECCHDGMPGQSIEHVS